MHVHFHRAGERRARRVEEEHTSPPSAKEVLGRRFRGAQQDRHLAVILRRAHRVAGGAGRRVVFCEVGREGFQERLDQGAVPCVVGVGLRRARFGGCLVEFEGR